MGEAEFLLFTVPAPALNLIEFYQTINDSSEAELYVNVFGLIEEHQKEVSDAPGGE